ncbi:MAG: HEAT repeat domain-containing protein [Rudaea sp.]
MAIVLRPENEDRTTLADFLDKLDHAIDLEEADSLIGLAADFRALANDPDMLPRHINAALKRLIDAKQAPVSASSIELASSKNYSLRATVWMPAATDPLAPSLHDAPCVHNHNFNVMAIGYFGPGYVTDIYAYRPNPSLCDIGERVDLRFLERATLGRGDVIIYRESIDAHVLIPPPSVSVSMSLAIFRESTQTTDQYRFDPQSSTIAGFGETAAILRRASVVRLAGEIGNAETIPLLDALLRRSKCRRVREAAVIAASRLVVADVSDRRLLIERGSRDSDEWVRRRAKSLVADLKSSTAKKRKTS